MSKIQRYTYWCEGEEPIFQEADEEPKNKHLDQLCCHFDVAALETELKQAQSDLAAARAEVRELQREIGARRMGCVTLENNLAAEKANNKNAKNEAVEVIHNLHAELDATLEREKKLKEEICATAYCQDLIHVALRVEGAHGYKSLEDVAKSRDWLDLYDAPETGGEK